MHKVVLIIIALYCFYNGFNGLFSGEISGVSGRGATSIYMISFETDPIQYSFAIMLNIIGVMLSIKLFFSNPDDEDD